jgi:hypothetical protein
MINNKFITEEHQKQINIMVNEQFFKVNAAIVTMALTSAILIFIFVLINMPLQFKGKLISLGISISSTFMLSFYILYFCGAPDTNYKNYIISVTNGTIAILIYKFILAQILKLITKDSNFLILLRL